MRKNVFRQALAAVVGMLIASGSSAATLIVNGSGQLTGATGVDVNGTLYDVGFVDGTCSAVFSGCDDIGDFQFTSSANASAAAVALLAQVFIDGAGGLFDSQAFATSGCQTLNVCAALIPYSLNNVYAAINFSAGSGSDVTFTNGTLAAGHDTSADGAQVWARFSPSVVAAVPEPSTWAMLLIGFGAVCAAARRKKRISSAAFG